MKRTLFLLLTICLVVGLLSVTVSAETLSGYCSDGKIVWTLDEAGTMTFTGSGWMEETTQLPGGEYSTVPQYDWRPYKDRIHRVVIGEGITSVGYDAFNGCKNLTEVELPQSLKVIGSYAFIYCPALTSIDLPTTNELYIDDHAFTSSGLTEIVLPDNVTDVGVGAFSGCTDLTRAKLSGNQFYMLRESVFGNCTSLKEIDFGTSVTRINDSALYNTGFETLVIPDTITFLGDHALANCKNLTELDLGDGMAIIMDSALQSCKALKKVTVGTGLYSIHRYAFKGCTAIEELHIPDLETWCSVETEYTESSPIFYAQRAYIGGVLVEDLVLPEHITSIDMYAFQGLDSLKSVVIHDKLESFRGFEYCPNLTEVIIGSGVKNMGDGTFRECESLETVIFRGSAPQFKYSSSCFYRTNATCYYPENDPTWTEDARRKISDWVTWVPYNRELGVGNPFSDVPWDSFFYESVMWAQEEGITNGLTPTEFGPNAVCNRAQVVTFLWRAAGCPEPAVTENPFVDVEPGSFYEKAVLWAVEKGITTGTDETHFSPNMPCNRATVVTFLYRAFEEPAVEGAENPFTDVPADSWYTAPVLWAVEMGITNGLSADSFGPNTACNRAQIVTFLYRAYTE